MQRRLKIPFVERNTELRSIFALKETIETIESKGDEHCVSSTRAKFGRATFETAALYFQRALNAILRRRMFSFFCSLPAKVIRSSAFFQFEVRFMICRSDSRERFSAERICIKRASRRSASRETRDNAITNDVRSNEIARVDYFSITFGCTGSIANGKRLLGKS